ncbi:MULTISPECIES: multicopper oxidase family protein [Rhodobacterales]|uniref:Copper oxidase n=1 Tax=Pelagivirga sediminicola TaxID=2170575 RepID=A0A2T7G3N6_9RHOB|nr:MULTISPECIES: multicopper oxidase family protein [Rhodobacterales]MCQ0090377.1 multicopper oxidase family protein [Roseovarius sp. M141]PVA09024.1 copper oxidase [Pelagivirga sediminicola]
MPTRRNFLLTGVAATAGLALPTSLHAATPRFAQIKARKASIQLAPSPYPETGIWGYGGAMPGSELRLAQGARLQRSFVNELPQASSIHWHGIRIDNAMDGVAGLTQPAVEPGQNFDYDFVVPDAGTYWYHAHNRSAEQVARGLYGALIVEESEPPDVDREQVLILDDWLLDPETAQIDPDFTSRHDRSHAGRRGNFIATNGRHDLSLDVRQNERLRLRLINAANARIFELALAGMEGWTIALDGMPLAQPKPLAETLILGPGQRADLIVDVTAAANETAHLVRIEDQEGISQVAFPVIGRAAVARCEAPAPLPRNPRMEIPGIDSAVTARLNMQGGAMGTLDAAILNGERKSFRQLVEANEFWAFNGTIGMTDTPLVEVSRGETVKLQIYNDTSFPHAMHLHGLHFREIGKDGGLGPFRDTSLMFGGETRTIAFVADAPGDWLFHCHVLSHAASGMMTWLKVT